MFILRSMFPVTLFFPLSTFFFYKTRAKYKKSVQIIAKQCWTSKDGDSARNKTLIGPQCMQKQMFIHSLMKDCLNSMYNTGGLGV